MQDPRTIVFQVLDSAEPSRQLVETVSFKVDTAKRNRFVELAAELKTDSKRNPGSLSFDLHSLLLPPTDHYAEYLLYELWSDRDSLRRQWESDFLRVFQDRLVSEELLVSPPDLRFYWR
jgi:quinol monooxygenase YgiN